VIGVYTRVVAPGMLALISVGALVLSAVFAADGLPQWRVFLVVGVIDALLTAVVIVLVRRGRPLSALRLRDDAGEALGPPDDEAERA
jgi:hypothetical protein